MLKLAKLQNSKANKVYRDSYTLPEPVYAEQKIAKNLLEVIQQFLTPDVEAVVNELAQWGLVVFAQKISDFGGEAMKAYHAQDRPLKKIVNIMNIVIWEYLGDPSVDDVKNFEVELKNHPEITKSAAEIAVEIKQQIRDNVRREVYAFAKETLCLLDGGDDHGARD